MPTPRLRLTDRLATALRVLRGDDEATRAVIPLTFPNFPGAASGLVGTGTGTAGVPQMALVRTANPQEYKPDGASVRVQGFTGHPIVHACIRAVADIVASIPFVVLRQRGDYESRVGPEHPLQRLLDYPGPRFTARAMRAKIAVDYLGYGNVFLQMTRGATGQGLPRQLSPINPESLQTVWVDANGDPRRYDYGNWAGIIVHVLAEDIIHIRDLDMPRPFAPDVFGFPRGATALGSIAADNEATKYVRQVVTNDGTPTFAVLMTDEATQDDATAMQDRYKARTVDRGKRGTPAFFGGVRDVKPLGFTLSDLEFPDLRRVSREDICAAFGVDPRMIGVASATKDGGLSGAQYVEARARLVQHTIEPMLSAIEDELNHWLSSEFGEVYICYDADVLRDLVENDEQTSKRVREEFAASLRTWEESRRALKLSPLPVPTDTLAMQAGTTLIPAATAVIDPAAIVETPPAEIPVDGGVTTTGRIAASGQIRAAMERAEGMKGMCGEQLEQVAELLESVIEGELPRAAVEALLTAAFPELKPALIAEMLDAVEDFEPEEEDEDEEEAPELPEVDGEDGGEDDGEDDGEDMVDASLAPYRAEATDFPKKGDNKKVSLRNSNFSVFPVAEAETLKREFPAIWRKGGNIRGNRQFAALAPIAKAGGAADTPAEERAVRLREAWAARHRGNKRIAGVIAQVKWLVVGDIGLDGMRAVIAEAKAKDRRQRAVATMPAPELPSEVAPLPLEDAQGRPWWVHHPEALGKQPARIDDETDLRFRYWKRTMDELDRREKEFYRPAMALFASQKRSVARLFAEASTNRAIDPTLDEIERRIRADYAPGGDYYAAWREAYLKLIEETYLFGAQQVAGVGFSFGLRPPEVMQAIANRASRLAELVGQDTARQVTAAIRAGELGALSVREISQLIQATVYGERMTDTRATRIARTESAGSVGQGSWDQAQAMDGLYQSKEWLAFADGKTRPTHTACMGQGRIPMSQPFGPNGMMYPHDPRGTAAEIVNCFPAGTIVEGKVIGGLKAQYAGQLREIVTKAGKRLTMTPNHPVLTKRGWVPAAKLAKGDDLFSYSPDAVAVTGGVVADNEQYAPACIEDVFDAMASDGGVRLVDVSELDLHGDAVATKGAVHVVRSNRKLEDKIVAAFPNSVQDDDFSSAHSGIGAGNRLGPLDAHGQRVLLAAPFGVSGGDLSRDEGGVALDLLPLEPLRIGSSAHGNPVFSQASKEEWAAVPGFIRELLETHAGLIQLDEVDHVRDFHATCHVYDLETVDGWMIANGIVTSNCRCTMAYFADPVPVDSA